MSNSNDEYRRLVPEKPDPENRPSVYSQMVKPPAPEPVADQSEAVRSANKFAKGFYGPEIAHLAKAYLALVARGTRTPGFIEACPGCGVPREYTNGDRGSKHGCDGENLIEAGMTCPIRAAQEKR